MFLALIVYILQVIKSKGGKESETEYFAALVGDVLFCFKTFVTCTYMCLYMVYCNLYGFHVGNTEDSLGTSGVINTMNYTVQ